MRLRLASVFFLGNVITSRPHIFVVLLFWEPLGSRTEKLKLPKPSLSLFVVLDIIVPWSRFIIFVVNKLPQLSLESVVGFVDLSFKVRLQRLRSEHC